MRGTGSRNRNSNSEPEGSTPSPRAKLISLGFPQDVVDEAIRADEKGLFTKEQLHTSFRLYFLP